MNCKDAFAYSIQGVDSNHAQTKMVMKEHIVASDHAQMNH